MKNYKIKAKIKARALVITELKVNIKEKVNQIESLSDKIDREYESLAQLLRNTNEFDKENLIVNLILSNDSISNFYSDLESFNSIKQGISTPITNFAIDIIAKGSLNTVNLETNSKYSGLTGSPCNNTDYETCYFNTRTFRDVGTDDVETITKGEYIYNFTIPADPNTPSSWGAGGRKLAEIAKFTDSSNAPCYDKQPFCVFDTQTYYINSTSTPHEEVTVGNYLYDYNYNTGTWTKTYLADL